METWEKSENFEWSSFYISRRRRQLKTVKKKQKSIKTIYTENITLFIYNTVKTMVIKLQTSVSHFVDGCDAQDLHPAGQNWASAAEQS